jgi:hypothetical protein
LDADIASCSTSFSTQPSAQQLENFKQRSRELFILIQKEIDQRSGFFSQPRSGLMQFQQCLIPNDKRQEFGQQAEAKSKSWLADYYQSFGELLQEEVRQTTKAKINWSWKKQIATAGIIEGMCMCVLYGLGEYLNSTYNFAELHKFMLANPKNASSFQEGLATPVTPSIGVFILAVFVIYYFQQRNKTKNDSRETHSSAQFDQSSSRIVRMVS